MQHYRWRLKRFLFFERLGLDAGSQLALANYLHHIFITKRRQLH